jgi:hypothetical protein
MNTAELATFAVNVAVCPAPYVRWMREVLGNRSIGVTAGDGLVRFRQGLYADGRGCDADYWWEVASQADARSAAREVLLALDTYGLPIVERYLDRDRLVEAAWTKPIRDFKGLNDGLLPAILLSDEPASPELERALVLLDADPKFAATARWVRERSVAATRTPGRSRS